MIRLHLNLIMKNKLPNKLNFLIMTVLTVTSIEPGFNDVIEKTIHYFR